MKVSSGMADCTGEVAAVRSVRGPGGRGRLRRGRVDWRAIEFIASTLHASPAARSRDRPGPLPLLPADEVLGVLEAAAAVVPGGLRIGADGSRSTGKVRARGDHLLGPHALLPPVHP